MPSPRPTRVPFPVRGLHEESGFDEMPPRTTTHMTNVRAQDTILGRARGGRRPGLSKWSDSQVNGSEAVQAMLKIVRSGGYSNSLTGVLMCGGYSSSFGQAIEVNSGLAVSHIAGTSGSPLFDPGGQVFGFDKDGEGSYYLLTNENTGYTGAGSARSVFKVDSGGNLIWSYNPDTVGATPAAMCYEPVNNRIYIACQSWTIASVTYRLVSLNAENGELVWALDIGAGSTNDMVVPGPDGTIYFGTNDTTNWPSTDGTTYSIFRVSAAGTVVAAYNTGDDVTCIAYNAEEGTVLFGGRNVSTTWTGSGGANANMFHADAYDFSVLTGIEVARGVTQTKKIHSCGFLTADTFVYGHGLESGTNVFAFGMGGSSLWTFNTGAATAEESPAVCVGVDGEVYVGGSENSSEDVWRLNGTTGAEEASTNTPFDGGTTFLSGRAVQTGVDSSILLTRATSLVTVAGGTVKRIRGNSVILPANGTNAMTREPYRVNMEQLFARIYMVDGENSKIYDLADETVKNWAAEVTANGSGTLPANARLLTRYRGRMVLAGTYGDPHNWHMSRQGNALDWNTAPSVVTAQIPVSGNNSEAGLVGDIITALIPFSDDAMLFGCDSSLWQMSGDPAAGGAIDMVSDRTGVAWGQAWTKDPGNRVYFLGTDGIYAIEINSKPVSLTDSRIAERFKNIDLSNTRVFMEWDAILKGLVVLVANIPADTTTMFFWDSQQDSWSIDEYPASVGPSAIYAYDAEEAEDTAFLLGGKDGYIRRVDSSAVDDDGTGITNAVRFPPIPIGDGQTEGILTDVIATLGENSGAVTMRAYVGQTAEQVAAATTPRFVRTLRAGTNNVSVQRCRGRWVQIELGQTAGQTRWACESLYVKGQESGFQGPLRI